MLIDPGSMTSHDKLTEDIWDILTTNKQNIHDELTSRIIEQQTLKVDVVTGATVSSKAFLKAVENALSY